MKLAFKKILMNGLALVVMMLPLNAMSMPVDTSADDCMNGDMTTMQHEDHPVSSMDADNEQAQQCDCCEQCVNACTSCVSMTAVTFNLLKLSDLKAHEMFAVTASSLFARITSPPSRPPRTLNI